MRAPDYAEPLIGWRVWLVVERPGGPRLASVLHDEVWPLGRATVARCRRADDPLAERDELPPHSAPHPECTCGIHAARRPEAALSYLRGRDDPGTVCRVLGTVALWGRVVELEEGWRAERAYPLRLFADEPSVRVVGTRYRVSSRPSRGAVAPGT